MARVPHREDLHPSLVSPLAPRLLVGQRKGVHRRPGPKSQLDQRVDRLPRLGGRKADREEVAGEPDVPVQDHGNAPHDDVANVIAVEGLEDGFEQGHGATISPL